MAQSLSTTQKAELEKRLNRQQVLAQQDVLTDAEKTELLALTGALSAVFCTGWPMADRVRAAIGEAVLASLGAKKLQALESGTAVFFDFAGSPSRGTRIWISVDDETGLFRVQLLRLHGAPLSETSRQTLVQGKRGVALLELSRVVQDLSRHGRR